MSKQQRFATRTLRELYTIQREIVARKEFGMSIYVNSNDDEWGVSVFVHRMDGQDGCVDFNFYDIDTPQRHNEKMESVRACCGLC